MRLIYAVLLYLVRGVRVIIFFLILVTLFGFVKPYISNVASYSYLTYPIRFDQQLNTAIKYIIPTQIAGKEVSRVIVFILLLVLSKIGKDLDKKLSKERMKKQLLQFRVHAAATNHLEMIHNIEKTIEMETNFKGKNRKQLLNDFIKLKHELEKTGRYLSFLSIDVVDSTGMKQGEEPVVIESDFNAYHNFVESKFIKHGYLKAAWTPDGVMACFNNTEQAVDTARDILIGLIEFNKTKLMKADFHVRCGINSGFVYYDLSTPLEEFSDRTIDIAGHMQKQADIDSLFIAKELVKPIQSNRVFHLYDQAVDGLEVCKWNISPK